MLQIDYKSGVTICDQIVSGFIRLIAMKVLNTGDSMPSVRNIASQLSVNPNTIQKAYGILEEKGVIYSVKGKGSFVADSDKTKYAIIEHETKNLKSAICSAYQVGYSKDEIIKIVNSIYKEGGVIKDD